MPNKTKDFFFVGIQLLLFFCYILELDVSSFSFDNYMKYFFMMIALVGGSIISISVLQLKSNLSIFPSPKEESSLVINGIFKYARHPIYSGIILAAFSLAIFYGSVYKIIISLFLWTLFYFKSSYEEVMLQIKFPEYQHYKDHVGRFFPKIF